MSTPLSEICTWAAGIPVWEQETLRRLLADEPFDGSVYAELASILLGEKSQEPVDFSKFDIPAPAADSRPVLLSVSDATNVNALAPAQSLEFGPALTVVYGLNGAGKSGYARIFGNACFCRGDRDVLPNLFDAASHTAPQTADITIAAAGGETTIRHDFKSNIAALAGFYVFDSTSVLTHLSRENTLSFSPLGLSRLGDLVAHTDEVRNVAQGRIDAACKPHNFSPLFRGETKISRAIAQLGEKSNIEEAKLLGVLTPDEQTRKQQATDELARVRSENIPTTIVTTQNEIGQLRNLRVQISDIEEALSESTVSDLKTALEDVENKRVKAAEAGSSQFANPHLKGVGSDAWSEFIRAAKKLSNQEEAYPSEGGVCLLCQQPLTPDAIELLKGLWVFLEGEARRLLEASEKALSGKAAAIRNLVTDICSPASAINQVLVKKANSVLLDVEKFLSAAVLHRQAILDAIAMSSDQKGSNKLGELSPLEKAPLPGLDTLLESWATQLEFLKTRDTTARVKELEEELLEFEHRLILGENIEAIEKYVNGLVWAAKARRMMNTSRHITKAHNDIFERQVSVEFRGAFERYVKALGRPISVKVETRSLKGEALKALRLVFPEGSNPKAAAPQQILCEGEKRAVSLADFLAEVAVDPASAGIILDDPVTSLDHEWKEKIAEVLVAESKNRQVIIFTHDLHFLYLLKNTADDSKGTYQAHWIERHFSDNSPGYISLNATPATERDFKSTKPAATHLEAAKNASSAPVREAAVRAGIAALRATYEQFVLNDLFGDVVRRFDSRISIDRLKDARIDGQTVERVIKKTGALSRYIEAHSHSDAAAHSPTVQVLETEIKDFEEMRAAHKAAKKADLKAVLAPA